MEHAPSMIHDPKRIDLGYNYYPQPKRVTVNDDPEHPVTCEHTQTVFKTANGKLICGACNHEFVNG